MLIYDTTTKTAGAGARGTDATAAGITESPQEFEGHYDGGLDLYDIDAEYLD